MCMYYVCVHMSDDPDQQQQTLPQLEVEKSAWCQWWSMVKRIVEIRPAVETIVLSAFIIAMQHTQCECTFKMCLTCLHIHVHLDGKYSLPVMVEVELAQIIGDALWYKVNQVNAEIILCRCLFRSNWPLIRWVSNTNFIPYGAFSHLAIISMPFSTVFVALLCKV